MNKNKKKNELRNFYILWGTQGLSQLGSSITAFALTLWLYAKTGSSLSTAALTICSYAPYVLISIFAGALIDRFDKKRIMLLCDTFAAVSTLVVFLLYKTDTLEVWHLYVVNVLSGLMNTVQQPASEVATTLLIPQKYYQKASGLQSLSRAAVSILNPLLATALYGFAGLDLCIAIDLFSFLLAFVALAFFIHLPESRRETGESVLTLAKEGLSYVRRTPLVSSILFFMSGVNLIASAVDATMPGFVIPNPKGGSTVLGIVSACAGIAMVLGSLIVSVMPKPKNRVRVIYLTMIFSLGTENFLLAFSREPVLWCIGQLIGWIVVPIMSANEEVILRSTIPLELQGRVYACRNTMQFFTIPVGLFLGGLMVDKVCEPFMADHIGNELLTFLFGSGKGSGAALMLFLMGVAGVLLCLFSGRRLRRQVYVEKED